MIAAGTSPRLLTSEAKTNQAINQGHVGKRHANRANDLTLPAYTTADLALKWQPSDATTLALHGHNIFNRHYYSTVYYNEKQWFVGESRRVLFTIDHRF